MRKDFSLRAMTEHDVPGADELRRVVGWNQTLEDWRELLRLQSGGCFVALEGGRIIGSVTTTTYGRALAWIGMMLVHSGHRKQGLGLTLMRQALHYLQTLGVACIKLDATPAGYPLYEKLGFVSEWTLTRWQRPALPAPAASAQSQTEVREFRAEDWPALEQLDTAVLGASRQQLLRSLERRARLRLVWQPQGRITGWGLLRPGTNADYLGPVESSRPEVLSKLVPALLGAATHRSVFWDIPDDNESAREAAAEFGFSRVRPLTRMRLGPSLESTESRWLFAIADPAVG